MVLAYDSFFISLDEYITTLTNATTLISGFNCSILLVSSSKNQVFLFI